MRIANYITVIMLIIMMIPVFCTAQETSYSPVADPGELARQINQQSSTIGSIESRFTQQKVLAFLDETITSEGKFWFKKENSLRWEYEDPFPYVIVLHKGQFSIRDGEDISRFDMDSNEVFREINDLIISLVRGQVLQEERFEFQARQNPEFYLLSLVPKDPQMREVIANMEIYFDKTDLMVSKIIMKESEEDYTLISFTDRRINGEIDEAVFDPAR
jgi:outer membrane lipoprotein-sorting protein